MRDPSNSADGGPSPPTDASPAGPNPASSFVAGLRGAVVVGALSVALIAGLWLVSRGGPSAAADPTFPVPAPTVSARERFGLEIFPTARAVLRRQPAPRVIISARPTATKVPTVTDGARGLGGSGRTRLAPRTFGTPSR